MKRKISTRALVVTAMLSAIAFGLMFAETSIPSLIPYFVKMDISDLPALLGAFALGPVYGVIIEFLKNLLHIFFKGTSSAYIGELFNFVCGSVFAAAAGLVYRFDRTRKGAIIGSLLGCLVMALLSLPLNYYIVYPLYATMFGGMENIIGAYQALLPSVNGLFACLLIFNVPFTFCKGLIDALICYYIYKPLSPILHGQR